MILTASASGLMASYWILVLGICSRASRVAASVRRTRQSRTRVRWQKVRRGPELLRGYRRESKDGTQLLSLARFDSLQFTLLLTQVSADRIGCRRRTASSVVQDCSMYTTLRASNKQQIMSESDILVFKTL